MEGAHTATRAWLQVLASFMVMFNAWGTVSAFGAYQQFYESGHLFQASPSAISWIGSTQGCLLLLLGIFTGPLYDAGYSWALLSIGSFLIVFGQMMLSLCTQYWQALLAQGLCMGLGIGCVYVPTAATITVYFTKETVAFALGAGACGSSVGGVVYPIVFQKLQSAVGFGWAARIIGFVQLVTLSISLILLRPKAARSATRKLVDWTALRDVTYVTYVAGATIGFSGLWVPFFYLQQYIVQGHLASRELGFYALAIINGASAFGRLVPNFYAGKVGPLNILLPCILVSGIVILLLPVIDNLAGVVSFCVVFGIFSGTFVSIPTAILVSITPIPEYVGTRIGMAFAAMSIGLLVGNPIAGILLDATSFRNIWVFSGSLVLASGVLVFLARMRMAHWMLWRLV